MQSSESPESYLWYLAARNLRQHGEHTAADRAVAAMNVALATPVLQVSWANYVAETHIMTLAEVA